MAAIVVNYRTADLTIACVDSLLRSAGARPHVVIVDNASGDDSAASLRARYENNPAVTLLVRDKNDGYAGGNNAGLRAIRTAPVPPAFAFVLNSDTVVDPDCVRLLLQQAQRDPRTALVAPRIVFGDRPDLLWFGGARFSLWTGRPVHVGLHQPVIRGWQNPASLPFATGCALLIRLSAVQGPLFDETLFSYAEDLDLSLRLRERGYDLRFAPDAHVTHFEGSSHRRAGGQAFRFYLTTRNLLRVLARHARWYHWITLGPMFLVDVIGRYSAVAVRDRDPRALAAVFVGAWHAVSGGRHQIERGARPTNAT